MIKLIVMDLDGTLLPYGATSLSDETKALLRCLRAQGKTLAFSSGRTYEELTPYVSEWKDDAYLMGCEGAYTVYQDKNIYERKIELEDLIRFFRQESCSFVMHGGRSSFGYGELPPEAAYFSPLPIQRIGDIQEKVFKVTTFGPPLRLPPLSGLRIQWDGGKRGMMQYVNRFANKGTALSDLQMRLMISGFETVCLGDSENDVPMMRNAKMTYCVGDRCPQLSRICNHHVATVEEALRQLTELEK